MVFFHGWRWFPTHVMNLDWDDGTRVKYYVWLWFRWHRKDGSSSNTYWEGKEYADAPEPQWSALGRHMNGLWGRLG